MKLLQVPTLEAFYLLRDGELDKEAGASDLGSRV